MWAFVAKVLEKITFGAIKSGVDTVKSATAVKKNLLTIKLKENELADRERLVRPATFEQIEKYDPKVELIRNKYEGDPTRVEHIKLRLKIDVKAVVFGSLMIAILVWLIKHFGI